MIHYLCPECENEGELPDGSPVKYCGICAGDVGRDVALRLTFTERVVDQIIAGAAGADESEGVEWHD